MGDRKVLLGVIVAFLVFTLIANIALILKIDSLDDKKYLGKVTEVGTINLCILEGPSTPISFNTTCDTTMNEDETLFCFFEVINDSDAQLSSNFLTSPTLFSITSNGTLNFTSNQTHVGNHSYTVSAVAGPSCAPNMGAKIYNLEILNVNDAPYLIENIPNQKWSQDTSITPFDLDTYFDDEDGDELSYYSPGTTHISVSINDENEVTFIPSSGFYGIEYTYFNASDPDNASVLSNIIKLTVLRVQDQDDDDDSSTSSSGGGSGYSSGSFASCISQWQCTEWGLCEPDNFMRRVCTDSKNCTVPLNKPNETENCLYLHTCFDGILSPGEHKIDCGGVCPPCPSCDDGIQNQEETGIDCGGPCKPCKTTLLKPGIVKNIESPFRVPREGRLFLTTLIMVASISALLYGLYTSPTVQLALASIPKKLKKKKEIALEVEARETLLERLAKLEKKIKRTKKEELLIEFSAISRDYFKILFSIDYQFTYEELQKELKSIKAEDEVKKLLLKFFEDSSEIAYSGTISITKNQIRKKIDEFRKIIEITSIKDPDIKKPITVEEKQKMLEYQLDKIFLKISTAQLSIKNGDINKAYRIYLHLLKEYKKLSSKEQKRVVRYIHDIYNHIKRIREGMV